MKRKGKLIRLEIDQDNSELVYEELSPSSEQIIREQEKINFEVEQIDGFLRREEDYQKFVDFLNKAKLKKESIKIIFDRITEGLYNEAPLIINDKKQVISVVSNKYIDVIVGKVKYRKFHKVGNKQYGTTDGSLVRKSSTVNETEVKHLNTWLNKKSRPEARNIGEEICEYIGTNFINYYMGENSPKMRLIVDEDGTVSLASKFIRNFKTFGELDNIFKQHIEKEQRINPDYIKGQSEFYFANIILADYDNSNPHNYGFRINNNGELYLARIDLGKAFSYKRAGKKTDEEHFREFLEREEFIKEKQKEEKEINLEAVKSNVFRSRHIKIERLFSSLNFNLNLYKLCQLENKKIAEKIIISCFNNIFQAYGYEVLNNTQVREELYLRMNIPQEGELTPKVLSEHVSTYIENLTKQIEKESIKQCAQILIKEDVDSRSDIEEFFFTLEKSERIIFKEFKEKLMQEIDNLQQHPLKKEFNSPKTSDEFLFKEEENSLKILQNKRNSGFLGDSSSSVSIKKGRASEDKEKSFVEQVREEKENIHSNRITTR